MKTCLAGATCSAGHLKYTHGGLLYLRHRLCSRMMNTVDSGRSQRHFRHSRPSQSPCSQKHRSTTSECPPYVLHLRCSWKDSQQDWCQSSDNNRSHLILPSPPWTYRHYCLDRSNASWLLWSRWRGWPSMRPSLGTPGASASLKTTSGWSSGKPKSPGRAWKRFLHWKKTPKARKLSSFGRPHNGHQQLQRWRYFGRKRLRWTTVDQQGCCYCSTNFEPRQTRHWNSSFPHDRRSCWLVALQPFDKHFHHHSTCHWYMSPGLAKPKRHSLLYSFQGLSNIQLPHFALASGNKYSPLCTLRSHWGHRKWRRWLNPDKQTHCYPKCSRTTASRLEIWMHSLAQSGHLCKTNMLVVERLWHYKCLSWSHQFHMPFGTQRRHLTYPLRWPCGSASKLLHHPLSILPPMIPSCTRKWWSRITESQSAKTSWVRKPSSSALDAETVFTVYIVSVHKLKPKWLVMQVCGYNFRRSVVHYVAANPGPPQRGTYRAQQEANSQGLWHISWPKKIGSVPKMGHQNDPQNVRKKNNKHLCLLQLFSSFLFQRLSKWLEFPHLKRLWRLSQNSYQPWHHRSTERMLSL